MAHSACPRRPLVAACALLLCAVDALHHSRPRRHSRPRHLGHRKGKGVPRGEDGLLTFRRAWERKKSAEEQSVNLTQPMPDNLSLVLGVMSVPADEPYRAVIRDTWMRHPLVCGIELVPTPNCVVHAGFVFGNATSGPVLRGGDLHFQMDGPKSGWGEGPLVRKMFLFFQYASLTFSWATHIVRLDEDFYPHFHVMLPFIQEYHAQGNAMEFLGYSLKSWGCGAAMDDLVTAREHRLAYCIQGCYMILSRPFAVAIAKNFSEYLDPAIRKRHAPDDVYAGHVVTDFVRLTRTNVTVVRGRKLPGFDHSNYK